MPAPEIMMGSDGHEMIFERSSLDDAVSMDGIEDDNGHAALVPSIMSDSVPRSGDWLRPSDRSIKASPSPLPSPSTSRLVVNIRAKPISSPPNTSRSKQASEKSQTRFRPRPAPLPIDPGTLAVSSLTDDILVKDSGLQPRKRGRPKGWKPGMSYAELRGDPPPRDWKRDIAKKDGAARFSSGGAGTPRQSDSAEPKRRGRPPKTPEFSAREYFLRSIPNYRTFGCEWDDEFTGTYCPAELQNMETLRRHVFLVHGDMDPLMCRWGKCARQKSPLEFVDEDSFRSHLEKAHFESYVWHMGDGIQNTSTATAKTEEDELPRYLFDEHGRQVTPSVKDQLFEDTAGVIERRRRLREIRRLANENAPDEEEFQLQTPGTGILGGSAL